MPSKSPAQHRLMEGIAHGWHPTGMKKAPPKDVAQDFARADGDTSSFDPYTPRQKKSSSKPRSMPSKFDLPPLK